MNEPVFGFDAPAIVACADDPAIVAVLLEFGADPNRRSTWWAGGFHALYQATGESAERLLAAGAVPDACAAAHLGRVNLLESLLEEDPSRVSERGGDGQTPLHFASSREVIDLLLTRGADLDVRDIDHRATAAEWMLSRRRGEGRYALAHYLVERGAAADLFLAAALGLTERAVELLRADPSRLDLRTDRGAYGPQPPSSYHVYFWSIGPGCTPLETAAQFEQDETLAAMLAFASPRQRLQLACRRGDERTAQAMVSASPDVAAELRAQDPRALADAAWRGDSGAVALLLKLEFDPAVAGHDQGTALHCAAWEGSVESVRALLAHPEAPQLLRIRDGRYNATPLGWCCHGSLHGNLAHDHAGVARLLLDAGATPEAGLSASAEIEALLASRAP